MSRPSTSARPLSLTEELEKLEQSITLTLQEIDSNFSRAHQIVTTKILPIVEQYADHSKAVWEGSKFWKQFFEASANVSLSGVEEKDEEEDEASYAQSYDNASSYAASSQFGEDTPHAEGQERRAYEDYDEVDDSILDSADISGSTPRAPQPKSIGKQKPNFADYPMPYEALRQELKGSTEKDEEDTGTIPTTPETRRLPDMSMTPTSSPLEPTTYLQSTTQQRAGENRLLHRVLDKNYRVQATPLTKRREIKTPAEPSWRDTTPMSSPPAAAPQLHAEIFSSPMRPYQVNAPRTPGVSVQPSAKKLGKENEGYSKLAKKDEITWESDSDEDAEGVYRELGMSPPKTIQFSLPQSRLLQTPAREASKRIVEDLLNTAGANFDETDDPESPSIVAVKNDLDDSF